MISSIAKGKAKRVLFWTIVVAVTAVVAFPAYWMVLTSLQNPKLTYTYPPKLLPCSIRLLNYADAFRGKPILLWLRNTLVVSVATSVLSVALAVTAAYSLARFRYRGRTLISVLLVATQMFPGAVLALPYYMLMKRLRLLDTFSGLALTYMSFAVPFCTWMLRGFFETIPIEIEDAARIDGCSPFRVLCLVVLPLSLPGIAATGLYAFILSWKDFLFARTLMASMARWTASVGIASYVGEYQTNWNWMMAAAVVFSIPIVTVFLGLQRYMVAGLTQGAVKG